MPLQEQVQLDLLTPRTAKRSIQAGLEPKVKAIRVPNKLPAHPFRRLLLLLLLLLYFFFKKI